MRSNSFHTLMWILLSTVNRSKYFQYTHTHIHTHTHTPYQCVSVSLNIHTHTYIYMYSDYATMHIFYRDGCCHSCYMDMVQQAYIHICWFTNIYIFIYEYIYSFIHSFNKYTKCLLWIRLCSRCLEYVCEHTRRISLPLLEITFWGGGARC